MDTPLLDLLREHFVVLDISIIFANNGVDLIKHCGSELLIIGLFVDNLALLRLDVVD